MCKSALLDFEVGGRPAQLYLRGNRTGAFFGISLRAPRSLALED
jgi:hypothetical protein